MTRAAPYAAMAVVSLAALLVACERPAETPAAPAQPAAAPSAPEPARKADPMTVWTRGVGALGAHTPFTVAAVKTAYPEAKVESGFLHEGATPTPIITVDLAGTAALELQGGADGKVARILVQGGGFRGPGGETLLQKWADAKFSLADCRMGQGRQIHAVVCKRSAADPVEYVFGVPGWTSDDLPSAEVMAEKGQLNEFVWTAPA